MAKHLKKTTVKRWKSLDGKAFKKTTVKRWKSLDGKALKTNTWLRSHRQDSWPSPPSLPAPGHPAEDCLARGSDPNTGARRPGSPITTTPTGSPEEDSSICDSWCFQLTVVIKEELTGICTDLWELVFPADCGNQGRTHWHMHWFMRAGVSSWLW